MAKPDQWQSYNCFLNDGEVTNKKTCEYFWPLKQATTKLRKISKKELKEMED
ncbi:MAG: hypothetical protein ACREBJ_03730 [Nitrosotalea sp.]